MKNMDAMVLAVVRAWARAGRPAPAGHRDRVHRRRGGQRRRTAPDSSPTGTPRCSRDAPKASASPAPSPSTPGPDAAALPHRRRGARHRLAEAHRARHGRPRLQGQPGQRGQPGSPPPSPGSASTSGRCGSSRPSGRRSPRSPRCSGIEADTGRGRPRRGRAARQARPAAALVEATVRNSANPTMLEAGYKVNVIPGQATAYVDGRMVPGGEEEFRGRSTGSPVPTSTGSSTTVRCRSRHRWTRPTYRRDARRRRALRARAATSCRTACPAAPTPSSSPGSASPGTASRR